MTRRDYNRFDKERQAQINKHRQAEYLKQSAREERRKADKRALERSRAQVEEFRENNPAPSSSVSQSHSANLAPDSRLGSAYRQKHTPPSVIPMTGNDLGTKPGDGTFRGDSDG